MLEKIKNVKWGYLIIGILLLAIGICFIAFNDSLSVLAISIGVILSIFAVVFGVSTIACKKRGFNFAVKIIFAVICLAAGIVTAVFDKRSVEILISLFSLLLIVDGSFKLNTSAMSKRYSVKGWWVMMAVAVAVIVSAFILAERTPENQARATVLLGAIIIVDALANILSVFWVARYESAQKAEIYYDACQEIQNNSDK